MGPEPRSSRPPIRYDELWLSSWLRLLLITGLVACLQLAFVAMLRRGLSMPGRLEILLVLLPVAGAFVGALSTTVLARPRQRLRRTLGYRLAELSLLLVLARLALWWAEGGLPPLSRLLYRPLESAFDGLFLLVALMLGIAWMMAAAVAGDFLEMALQPDELLERPGPLDRGWIPDGRVPSDRAALLRRFVGRWILGGLFLLLVTASSQVGPRPGGLVTLVHQPVPGAVMWAVLGYFLLGLVLLAIGRLAVLRARWQLGGTVRREEVVLSWPLYATGVLVLVALLAMALPLGGTFYLARLLFAAIQAIYLVFYTLFGLILVLFALLLSGAQSEGPSPGTPPPRAPEPPDLPPLLEPPPWLGGAIFWVLALFLVGYAGYVYLQDRGLHLGWLRWLWQQLWMRWTGVQAVYRGWRRGRWRAREENRRPDPSGPGRRRLRLRGLSPAEQIRRLYLDLVEEAGAQGLPRRESETPYRYASRLAPHVGPGAEDLRRLTEAFVAVRYARHRPDRATAARMQRHWRRLRDHVRRMGWDRSRDRS